MKHTNQKTPSQQMREVRGYAIISKGDVPKKVNSNTYVLASQNGNGEYTITTGAKFTCSCPDYAERKTDCKHIYAVKFFLDFNKKVTENKGIVTEKQSCPYCKSNNTIGCGKRHTKSGQKQRYRCKDCNRKFIENKDYERYKGNSNTTSLIMDLYFKGISLRGISDHLNQFYSLPLNASNILRRIQKFSIIINNYVTTLKPELKDIWNHDEMKIQAGGKWLWLWNIMDKDTKFLITTQVTYNVFQKDSDNHFKNAQEQAKSSPQYVLTDGRHSLTTSIHKVLPNAHHVRLVSLTDKRQNNQTIERLNGTIRDRVKSMRGFQNSITANIMTSAYRNYYNFVKPHQSLDNQTPAQVVGIGVENSANKWNELLKRSLARNF